MDFGTVLSQVMETVMFVIGIVMAAFATILIAVVTYSYFTMVLPSINAKWGLLAGQGLTVVGLWILGNILFNYYSAMMTGPGHAPKEMTREAMSAQLHDPELREGNHYRYCKQCQAIKPMRSHHCGICKRCVLKMDHHCPWVNNCVGWRNQRYFILFLVYLWAGSGFFLLTGKDVVFKSLLGRSRSTLLLIATIMSLSAFFATSLFIMWNIVLLATNKTTIEFWNVLLDKRKRGHPYNLGLQRNFREVFGHHANCYNWLLPSTAPPPGDGYVYPMMTRGGVVLFDKAAPVDKRENDRLLVV